MKKLLRLIFVALVFQMNFTQAFGSDGWLKVYACSDKTKAQGCKGCKLMKEFEIRFFVKEASQSVMMQGRELGVTAPPEGLSNCEVANQRNWLCKEPSLMGEQAHLYMADGTFFNGLEKRDSKGALTKTRYMCAK